MNPFSALVAAVSVLVATAYVTGSDQVPLAIFDKDDQKPINSSNYWYESIVHNGEASFMEASYKPNYHVFRNVVTDFGADNTGKTDASVLIQKAIDGT